MVLYKAQVVIYAVLGVTTEFRSTLATPADSPATDRPFRLLRVE